MKKRNHILALLAALALLGSLLAGCGSNEEPSNSGQGATQGTEEQDDTTGPEPGTGTITWSLDDGALTICGTGDMENYSSAESVPWYSVRETIYSVVIEPGVTSIGDHTFYKCPYLTSVSIPDSVTSIGEYAFCACFGLDSVTIPDSVNSIGAYAFSSCSRLTSVDIPDSVTSIGDSAFDHCYSLASVVIPDGVTSIGDYTFAHCYSLTSVDIPDSVTSIGECAFDHCTSLASVTIPDSVTSIGDAAFSSCSSLTRVYFTGTWVQFDTITIGTGNDSLLDATIYYNE